MLTRQHWLSRFSRRAAQKSYLNEVAELALSGVVPRRRRCWLGAFVGAPTWAL